MKNMNDLSVKEFVDELFSKKPVPGGGAASALVGAIAVSLAGMVAGITNGKKGYESYTEDLDRILAQADFAKNRLLALMDEDAKAYLAVSEIYKIRVETDEEKLKKQHKLEIALLGAAAPPLDMLEVLIEVRELFDELKEKGTPLAVSDVGIGAMLLHAAMKGAAMNVLVNTKLMKDRETAVRLEDRVRSLLKKDEGRTGKLYESMDLIF